MGTRNYSNAAQKRAWDRAMTHLARAHLARLLAESGDNTPQALDAVAGVYVEEVKKLFEQMLELRESGATGVITAYFRKRGQ